MTYNIQKLTDRHPTIHFFSSYSPQKSESSKIVEEDPVADLVHFVSNQIDNVPNKNIGNPFIDINIMRSFACLNQYAFMNYYIASAYFAKLYRTAQCGEYCNILYLDLEGYLPPHSIIEIFSARWRNGFDHSYIKIKLPKGYQWPDGSHVRFCDAWHIKDHPESKGIYSAKEMNEILKYYGHSHPCIIASETARHTSYINYRIGSPSQKMQFVG
jgi:hypothetical protein